MTPFSASTIAQSQKVFRAHLMTRPPRLVLLFSIMLIGILGATIAALIFVPWRQTVIGQGEVSIFDPLERPQTVDSQIKGRLVELYVKEGDVVAKDQLIAKLVDRDTKFLDPRQTERVKNQIDALKQKKEATYGRIEALTAQLQAITASREAKLASAEQKVRQTQQKLEVNRQMLRVGEQDLKTAQLQEERIAKLENAGLKSRRDYELTVQKRVEAETKLQKMKGDLLLNDQDIALAKLQAATIIADAAEKSQKARESIAKAREEVAAIEEKVQKLSNEAGALSVRRSLQEVTAPRAGRIVNLKKLGPGQLVKEGQTIARIVPDIHSRGVELYLSGVDAPLVEPGIPVRLMFEGFPAVPFAGWDWASVGTFGGRVVSVDPVNTVEEGKGGYRVWVLPDPEEPPWPTEARLRIGTKANGWLQLNRVPLYYELWRQLNAFPAQPSNGNGKKPKTKPVIRR